MRQRLRLGWRRRRLRGRIENSWSVLGWKCSAWAGGILIVARGGRRVVGVDLAQTLVDKATCWSHAAYRCSEANLLFIADQHASRQQARYVACGH